MTNEEFKAHILYKLANHRYWGGKHTQKRDALKGIDPKYHKEFEGALGELIKEGLILVAPKTKELHISLNPRQSNEIFELIEKWFKKDIVDPYR